MLMSNHRPHRGLMILSALATAVSLLVSISLAQQASEPACPLTSEHSSSQDYFPDKATVDPLSGFSIEYKLSHKIVNIKTSGLSYALNLCNALTLTNLPASTKLIKIPVAAAAADSQNALDAMFALGVGHLVKFTKPFDDPVVPCAQAAKANGSLAELTTTTSEAGYNVLFTSTVDATRARSVAIPLLDIDATPLQKAEWIKLIGAFFNLEKQANEMYKSIMDAYECRKRQVAGVATPKPVVAWIAQDPISSPNMWNVNQGNYARTLISDAGGIPLATNTNVPTADLLNALSTANVVIDATPRAGKNVELIDWLSIFGKSSIQDVNAPFAQRKKIYAVDHTVSTNGHEEFQLGHTLRPAFVLQDLISVLYPIAQGTSYSPRYLRNMATDDGYAAPLNATMCTAPLTPTSPSTSPLRIVPKNAEECPNVPAFTGSSSVMAGGDSTNSDQGKNEPPKRGSSAGVIFGAIVAVVFIAGFIVFVAPKLARKYRERKNRQYMHEML